MLSRKHRRFKAVAASIKKTKRVREEEEEGSDFSDGPVDEYDVAYWERKLGISDDKAREKIEKEMLAEDGFDEELLGLFADIDSMVKKTAKKIRKIEKSEEIPDEPEKLVEISPITETSKNSLTGLINRLSEGNLEQIVREISVLLKSGSGSDFASLMIDGAQEATMTMLGVYTAAIVAISICNGQNWGISALSEIGKRLENEKKSNLVKLVSLLFAFGLLGVSVIEDLVKFLKFKKSFEDLGSVFRFAGKKWRTQHPLSFNRAISDILSCMKSADSKNSKKIQFILQDLEELRSGKGSFAVMNHFDSVMGWLSNFKNGSELDFPDFFTNKKYNQSENSSVPSTTSTFSGNLDDLLKQAKQLRFNSEIQKSVFVALNGASCPEHAIERVLEIAKSRDWEDVAHVLVNSAVKSAGGFNEYWVVICIGFSNGPMGAKFISGIRKVFAGLLGGVRNWPEIPLKSIGTLLGRLAGEGIFGLSVMRFSNFSKNKDIWVNQFLKEVVDGLLLSENFENALLEIEKYQETRVGIALFMRDVYLPVVSESNRSKAEHFMRCLIAA